MRYIIFTGIIVLFFLTSCSVTKFVPDGSHLLDRVTVQTENNDINRTELTPYIRQMPNSSVFRVWRMQLRLYSSARKESPGFFGRVFQRVGEVPVIYDPIQTQLTVQSLTRVMHNKGFMHAEVSSETQLDDRQRARVTYIVQENAPYRLRDYTVDIHYEPLRRIASDSINSLIQPNMLFDVNVLDAERDRISQAFRELGYFRFNREMLIFEADSALNTNQVDLRMMLREFDSEHNDSILNLIFQPYRFRNIIFSTSRNIGVGGNPLQRSDIDSDYHLITRQENYIMISDPEIFLHLNTLINNTMIQSGEYFSDQAIQRTYAALNALPPIQYINVSLRERADNQLDAIITIAPAMLLSVSADVEATYTDGFWGVATTLGVVHRNVFRGAESLSLQGRMAYEWQGVGILAHELGAQASLLFPNFLMPFTTSDFRRNVRANTEFSTSVLSQTRPSEFDLNRVRAGTRYRWNQSRLQHSFDLLDISYVNFNITDEFYERFLASGIFNRYLYEDHLITRMAYSGIFSSFRPNRPLRNHLNLRYSIETAGNIPFAMNSLFGGPKNSDGFHTIFGVPYSQYIRADFNISYHQIFDEHNRFVYRLFVGAGTPFGNAKVIPWERRYFAGGANSVRGWGQSMLGPGVYQRNPAITRGRDYNQIGDIKLDLNFEYRYRMFGNLNGALFIDAGNIWTVRSYESQAGGEFRFNTFWRQLGIAYGTGLRLDFSFMVARLDFGIKLHDPGLPPNQRWRIRPTTRDMALHFAIGYPF